MVIVIAHSVGGDWDPSEIKRWKIRDFLRFAHIQNWVKISEIFDFLLGILHYNPLPPPTPIAEKPLSLLLDRLIP